MNLEEMEERKRELEKELKELNTEIKQKKDEIILCGRAKFKIERYKSCRPNDYKVMVMAKRHNSLERNNSIIITSTFEELKEELSVIINDLMDLKESLDDKEI